MRSPRNVRKLSNGEPVMPSAFAHQVSDWCCSAVFATTAPPTTSLWPLMYLVVEWITKSAPNSIGVCSAGDRKVLSTTVNAPTACAASITKRRSVMRSSGFDGVSIHTTAGCVASVSASARGSVKSMVVSSNAPLAASALNRRQLPPYASCGTTSRWPGFSSACSSRVMADMPVEVTTAPAPPSSSASASPSRSRVGLPLRV